MSAIDAAKLAPGYGAKEIRVYHFEAEELATTEETSIWVRMGGDGVSACCALSADQAPEIASGLMQAAEAIDAKAKAMAGAH